MSGSAMKGSGNEMTSVRLTRHPSQSPRPTAHPSPAGPCGHIQGETARKGGLSSSTTVSVFYNTQSKALWNLVEVAPEPPRAGGGADGLRTARKGTALATIAAETQGKDSEYVTAGRGKAVQGHWTGKERQCLAKERPVSHLCRELLEQPEREGRLRPDAVGDHAVVLGEPPLDHRRGNLNTDEKRLMEKKNG